MLAGDITGLYAFHHTDPDQPDKSVGWDFFDLQSEYLRMGVPNDHWKLIAINENYEVSHGRYCSVPGKIQIDNFENIGKRVIFLSPCCKEEVRKIYCQIACTTNMGRQKYLWESKWSKKNIKTSKDYF